MDKSQELNRPITLNELKAKAKGQLLEIPDFSGDGKSIMVRIKRIDFSKELLDSGEFNLTGILAEDTRKKLEKVTNEDEREKIITEDLQKSEKSEEDLKGIFELMDKVCKLCLLEPTWSDFNEVYPLTFQQKYFIFNWVIGDIKDLQPFRK